MCLNHPVTIPSLMIHGKIVFYEIGPWSRKGWGPLPYRIDLLSVLQTCLLSTTSQALGSIGGKDHGVCSSPNQTPL